MPKWLTFSLIGCLGLAIICGGAFYFIAGPYIGMGKQQAYLVVALQKGDASEIYKMTSPAYKQRVPFNTFKQNFDAFYMKKGPFNRCESNTGQQNGSTPSHFILTYNLSGPNGSGLVTVTVNHQGSDWNMDDINFGYNLPSGIPTQQTPNGK